MKTLNSFLFPSFMLMFILVGSKAMAQPQDDWNSPQGNSSSFSRGNKIVIDKFGFSYITGSVDDKLFVAKYNPGGTLNWSEILSDVGGIAEGFDIFVEDGGSVIATGKTSETSTSVASNCFTVKFDNSGNRLWTKTFNNQTSATEEGYAVIANKNGDIYIAGDTYTGNLSTGGPNEFDIVVLKYDYSGKLLWQRSYNGNTGSTTSSNLYDHVKDIALDNNGNVFVVGSSQISGTSSFSYDISLIKVTPSGTLTSDQWSSTGANYDLPASIAIASNDEVFVGGTSVATSTGRDFVILKYANALATPTVFRNSKSGDDNMKGMIMDANNNLFATGNCIGSSSQDILTIKFNNTSGTISAFSPVDGQGGIDDAADIGIDANGNIYVGGFVTTAAGYTDMAIVKYNSSGTFQSLKLNDGTMSKDDRISSLQIDKCANIYFTGKETSFTGGKTQLTARRLKQPGVINTGPELMMRDGLDDTGVEINNSDNIWESPDIWVRLQADGVPIHENPNFNSTTQPYNKVYTRILNTGCTVSDPATLRLFWTRARAGELWNDHWFFWDMSGSQAPNNFLPDPNNSSTKRPGGGEITIDNPDNYASASVPINIPSIPPMGSYTIPPVDWKVPNQAWYTNKLNDYPMICFLARLESSTDPINNITNHGIIKYNVQGSNNVITRNTYLTNDPSRRTVSGGTRNWGVSTLAINNDLPNSRMIGIRIANVTPTATPFIGDYGNLDVIFSEGLWNAWSGRTGDGFTEIETGIVRINQNDGTTFTNIDMPDNSVYDIGLFFNRDDDAASIEEPIDYIYEITALYTDTLTGDSVGSSSMVHITVDNASEVEGDGIVTSIKTIPDSYKFSAFPNPFSKETKISYNLSGNVYVSIELIDIAGKKVKTLVNNELQKDGFHELKISGENLTPGLYFCNLRSGNDLRTVRLVIQ